MIASRWLCENRRILALALLATIGAVGHWAANDFGPIDASLITRAACLVAVLSALGLQCLTNGFLWGLMNQKVAHQAPEGAQDLAEAKRA